MAGNATRTKTGAATKKAITGTSKSSNSARGFGQNPLKKLGNKYAPPQERGGTQYVSTGRLRGKGGSGDAASTRQYGTVTPSNQTVEPTYTAPKGKGSTGREEAISSGGVRGADTGYNGATTVTPTGVTTGTDISSTLTGNVGKYGIRPDAIPMLYQEPQALLRMAMANMGMSANDNQGMYQMALPNADLVNALSMIGLGGNKDYNAGEHDKVLNYMDNLFRQGLTKGGDVVDFSQGMSNIVNADSASPLASMLQNDDPRGQYSALSSLMLPLAEAGLHPLFARSLQKSMEALRDEYFQRYANGTPPTSMAQNMNSRLGLGG